MNCLIIDDDPLIGDLIKHFCSKQNWINSCLAVSDGSQALQAVNTTSFDFIFLDFNLPDLNGRSLLTLLPKNIPVIMVTSETEFGAESYNYEQVVDFLVKPVAYDRFLLAMQKVQHLEVKLPKKQSNRIVIKVGNDSVVLKLSDILYAKSEGNYVMFYLENEKVLGLLTLKQLMNELPADFVRVHKSFIVNLNHLKIMSTDELTIGQHSIPIGSSYKADLLTSFKKWSSGA